MATPRKNGPKRETAGRVVTLLNDDDYRLIEAAAAHCSLPISAWVRMTAVKAARDIAKDLPPAK
jgi:uncharacterized protein (DUF1778 family)